MLVSSFFCLFYRIDTPCIKEGMLFASIIHTQMYIRAQRHASMYGTICEGALSTCETHTLTHSLSPPASCLWTTDH